MSRRKGTEQVARVQQGELWEVEVQGYDAQGFPVGESDDGQHFRIAGGVPGDRVQARVLHVGKHRTWSRVYRVLKPSDERVSAPCEVMTRCGGCPWQAQALDAQRRARRVALETALSAVVPSELIGAWRGGDAVTGYRNRALMMARHLGGRLRLGFFEARTNVLVPAPDCAAQDPRLNVALEAVRVLLERHGVSTWRGPERPGWLRALSLRMDPVEGEGLLTLVVSGLRPELERLSRQLLSVEGVAGVHVNVNERVGGGVLGPHTKHLSGARRQRVSVGPVSLSLGPTSFVQTNLKAAECLVNALLEVASGPYDHVVDAYAGAGFFALAMAARARRVTAIEMVPEAAEDAVFNAKQLGLEHLEVISAKAGEGLKELVNSGATPDLVILDPPRAGCSSDVIEALLSLRATPRLIYVSCNPKSLARDLGRLCDGGVFKVESLIPVDMFVHTPHVESLVILVRA